MPPRKGGCTHGHRNTGKTPQAPATQDFTAVYPHPRPGGGVLLRCRPVPPGGPAQNYHRPHRPAAGRRAGTEHRRVLLHQHGPL